ncbi:MAG: hypothetical protein ETSY2_28545 [Candidatus Entotheonella gemina]|uniref:Type II toxin-antitoxin system RelE/ParE family toxin n=1 Tax=Candidatus Entotheonella gemina TaxID=1429439 RepID=W4M2Q6_9BACT|nr:MAG: hypothetical protein ETSY2_28545 [Candidatus Entotheonella gemina]
MNDDLVLRVVFFRTSAGREPVREWLQDFDKDDRKAIGGDIKLVQFRWPLGLPLVRKMEANLWEVRSNLSGGRIVRVFFTMHNEEMVLLHGFAKKSQQTPAKEFETAKRRRDLWLSEQSK